ncbi:MAG TPA: DUF4230 domain-containing protein [Candidatus Dojkabacteria bacterium]|mgnify:CR=1 FL=1|nr:DUF4230 domain-containing protein [Candidatus Dojkabacteria bacterium]
MEKLLAKIGTYVTIILIIVVTTAFGSIMIYKKIFENNQAPTEITSRTIVNKITDTGKITTKSVYSTERTVIEIDTDTAWNKFWWGQTISAEALVRTDVGVDLKKIEESDITVDNDNKTITIELPDAEIINISLDSEITVVTEKGILEKLFYSDNNKDYNLAMDTLKSQARVAVGENTEIFTSAQDDTGKILESIFKDTGYTIITK